MTLTADQAATDAPALLRDDADGIVTLTLNRPGQYNALSEELLDALQGSLDEIANDPHLRVVVLAGEGRAFSGGHDLKQMRAQHDEYYYEVLFAKCGRMMMSIPKMPQPVIAKVHGLTTAAGCQLVATCDLAVASAEARFATSGINLGLFCSTPAVPLSRNVPRKHAIRMLMTGEFISAERAAEIGLINEAVPPEQLDEAVTVLAAALSAKPPEVLRRGKELFYRQLDKGLADAYADAGAVMAGNMMLSETVEGIDAFIEKRKPNWPRSGS